MEICLHVITAPNTNTQYVKKHIDPSVQSELSEAAFLLFL